MAKREDGRAATELIESSFVENVPIVTCPHCGANKTLHELERIKLHRRALLELFPSLPRDPGEQSKTYIAKRCV